MLITLGKILSNPFVVADMDTTIVLRPSDNSVAEEFEGPVPNRPSSNAAIPGHSLTLRTKPMLDFEMCARPYLYRYCLQH